MSIGLNIKKAKGQSFTGEEMMQVVDAVNQLGLAVEAVPSGSIGKVEADTDPGTPATPVVAYAEAGVTYQYFLDENGDPITIPVKDGEQYVVSPVLIWNMDYWVADWTLVDKPDLSEDYVAKDDFAPVSDKVDSVTKDSPNKVDKSKKMVANYYATTGSRLANANWHCIGELIPCKPNTRYFLDGIKTTFVGCGYYENLASNTKFTEQLGTNTGEKTELDFTTGPDTYFLGINTDSVYGQDHTNTAMLYEYDGEHKLPYTPFGVTVNVAKIQDAIPGVTYETAFYPVKTKVDTTIEQSYNKIDKTKLVAGSNFGNSTGSPAGQPTASTSGKRTEFILIENNTESEMLLGYSGISADYPGNVFNDGEVETQRTRYSKIIDDPRAGTKEGFFGVPPGRWWIGMNISNLEASKPGAFDNTAMLYIATDVNDKRPYRPFGGYIDVTKIYGQYADVYYSFSASTNQFTVFCRFPEKKDLYFGFYVKRTTDATIRQDLWRIYGGNLFAFDGTAMTNNGKSMVSTNLENEGVYKQAGKADYSGGYHGDELFNSVTFFVNGIPINLPTEDLPLTGCNEFEYRQNSTMYEAPDAGSGLEITPTPIEQVSHIKKTNFSVNGITTNNIYKPLLDFDVYEGFVGLFCTGRSLSKKFYTRRSADIVTETNDNSYFFNEKNGSNQVFYFNETEKIGCLITGTINKIIQNGLDKTNEFTNDANLQVWSRPNDNKFYLRFGDKQANQGDVWDVQCHIKHFSIL